MTTASTRRAVTAVRVRVIEGGRLIERPDRLVTEEPMEIRVHGAGQDAQPIAVLMRTPGHDFELAVGFCRSAGLLERATDLAEVRYCLAAEPGQEQEYNVVTVATRRPIDLGEREQVAVACHPVKPGPVVTASTLVAMPDTLQASRTGSGDAGGLDAAGLFSSVGELHVLREDVGRLNAVDKLIGYAMLDDVPLSDSVLVVSGRLSFEIVQKAAVAGIPIVGSVAAPSSLAVVTAERFGQTLVGVMHDSRGNVYSHPERVDAEH